ncbi:MAG: hypothetical protein KDN22_16315 [Verrucomicrobiae bacterium]|nr:hypothetical protein [Verrucomicrobiae bacterium]
MLVSLKHLMLSGTVALASLLPPATTAGERIHKSERYPQYWEHGGKPVLLLGGSDDDNLFQRPDLIAQLDLLKKAGGNYVRNTMSCRDDGNVWPFAATADGGKFDLAQWNPEYWSRFARFLEETEKRGIIVQIEVWATFDFYRDVWARNPFNPDNNINYTAEETGLPTKVDSHPTQRGNNFFWSVPKERNQENVLTWQQAFVDKLLSISLPHGNVLYCMDNETSVTPEWGWFWSRHIQAAAQKQGLHVETTEMWDPWDLAHPMHNATFDHEEIYCFVDVSQNNHQKGQAHWDNAQKQRTRIAEAVRPLNNVKIYGADRGRFGSDRDGIERFCRNVFGGMASARFHRPDSGLGLNGKAQAVIKSMRMVTDAMDLVACAPRNDLLGMREENEAYCFANAGTEAAVFFPDGGSVSLDVSKFDEDETVEVRWMQALDSEWKPMRSIPLKPVHPQLELTAPGKGYWVVLVQGKD